MNQQDLRLDDIDFKWVENCDNEILLKKAIQLIVEDGDYYPDLKKAVQNKLQKIQPSFSTDKKTTQISKEEKKDILSDLEKWAQNLPKQPVSDLYKHEAENLKIKGDEALKSGDFEESINFYQKAISKNPKNELIYGNQSFAYMQLKKFKEAVQSASQSIQINKKYIKAYYRRAKANEALKNYFTAYQDVLEILRLEPSNSVAQKLKLQYEKNIPQDQLKNLQEQNEQNQNNVQKKNGKIKIQIEEQSDESDEEEDSQKTQILNKKQQCAELIQKGNFDQAINIFESYVRKQFVKQNYSELWVASMCNLSHCHKQQHDDDSVIAVCDEIIEHYINLDQKPQQKLMNMMVKTILRKAFSLERKEKLKFALENFLLAQKFQPYNPQVNQGVQRNLQTIKGFDNKFDINKLKKRVDIKFYQFKFNNKNGNQQQNNQQKEIKKEQEVQVDQTKIKEDKLIQQDNNNVKNLSGLELDRLIELKNEGNSKFKQKNFQQAIQTYTNAIQIFNKNQNDRDLNQSNQKVLVDLLSNRSLTYYYYKQYSKGIEDIKRVLQLTPDNNKAIYRLTLNSEGLCQELFQKASQVIDKKTKLDFYQQCIENAHQTIKFAQQILNKESNEKLFNSQKKANDILQQSQQKVEQIKSEIQNQKDKVTKKQNQEVKKEVTTTKEDSNQQQKKQEKKINQTQQRLSKEFEQKAQKIAEKGRQSLLENYKQPTTSSQFETELKSFGDQNQLAYQYLLKTPEQVLQNFYQKKQIEAQNLLRIFTVLEANQNKEINEEDSHKIFRICQIFPNGKKFNLSVMMLLKKEKNIIKNVIECVGKSLNLKNEDISKLKKLYKIKQFI